MKNIRIFSFFISAMLLFSIVLIMCLKNMRSLTQDQIQAKQSFVRLTGLPDLAIMTEARFIRHRSLSDLYSLFNVGPEIRDRFSVSFIYAPSPAMCTATGKVVREK